MTGKTLVCFFVAVFSLQISSGHLDQNRSMINHKIRTADSVVLISHALTVGYEVVKPPPHDSHEQKAWYKLNPLPPPFFYRGKLNRKIIKESISLDDPNKIILAQILLRKAFIKNYTPTKCDEPRHSIIIYKNNEQSYIDICFGCHKIHTSNDIYFSELYMDEKKWEELKQFYKKNGLTKVLEDNK